MRQFIDQAVSTSRHSGHLTKTILLSLSVHILLLIYQPPLKDWWQNEEADIFYTANGGVNPHSWEKKKMKDKEKSSKREKERERERAFLLWLGDATSVTPLCFFVVLMFSHPDMSDLKHFCLSGS